jgi:hypothetical protein
MTYTIKFTDGRPSIEESNMDAAIGILADLFGAEVVVGRTEQNGMEDEDGGQPMRRLVWDSEDTADDDDGSNAVASIRWTE